MGLNLSSEPEKIVKVGEGTYGEAFRAGDTVCKIVPIDGDSQVNGEVQKVLNKNHISSSYISLKSFMGYQRIRRDVLGGVREDQLMLNS